MESYLAYLRNLIRWGLMKLYPTTALHGQLFIRQDYAACSSSYLRTPIQRYFPDLSQSLAYRALGALSNPLVCLLLLDDW
ncbi:hypothetical protein DID88_007206 [Monilinia fructigena]|uniref:Uncharacterized protein n=1 Tax=Monilinia fructigena TaxID=38457 RepID=A0A395J8M2_9HELO|nr:hypothetical protein DID88_007206 [Monilinia fructigena]